MATVRHPRSRILVNGSELPTLVSGEITRTTNYTADTFELDFAINGSNVYDVDWWMYQQDVAIEIQAGDEVDGDTAWATVLIGKADGCDIDGETGKLTVHGRDQTALFIDNKIYKAFPNHSASDIVSALALSHGMEFDSDPTTGEVGTFYKADSIKVAAGSFSKARTEWDLITYLADKVGFDAWVSGNTLHFKKELSDTATPWPLVWGNPDITGALATHLASSVISGPKFHHDFTRAKDIKVIIRSRHARRGTTHVAERTSKSQLPGKNYVSGGEGAKKADLNTYVFDVPGLTPEQAEELSESVALILSKRQRTVEWSEPGDFDLYPRRRLTIAGAPASLDQVYWVEEVHFTFGPSGFLMNARAKNHPSSNQIAA
jgi:hypothetical protein